MEGAALPCPSAEAATPGPGTWPLQGAAAAWAFHSATPRPLLPCVMWAWGRRGRGNESLGENLPLGEAARAGRAPSMGVCPPTRPQGTARTETPGGGKRVHGDRPQRPTWLGGLWPGPGLALAAAGISPLAGGSSQGR